MKKCFLLLSILFLKGNAVTAQFNLYNTRTLYDAFENPAQKAYYADTSRTYAFNFLIPNFAVNAVLTGPAQNTFKRLLYKREFNTTGLEIGQEKKNHVYFNENAYIAIFRIFQGARFNQEIGFSWQIQSYGDFDISNEALTVFNKYSDLTTTITDNLFNNSGKGTAFHQFAFTYREDYNKRLGLGVKVSYLSGIAHSNLEINNSSFTFDESAQTYNLALRGHVQSNLLFDNPDKSLIKPGFKNPGAAISMSANYKLKNGITLLANVKDLGFITWSKSPYKYTIDKTVQFSKGERQSSLNEKLREDLLENPDSSKFSTLINSRAEILLTKNFNFYQPNLLISKNIFDDGGDIALINTYRRGALNLSVSTAYNLNNYFQLGGQFMLKSPNAEFFIGSDNLLKNYYTAKGFLTKNESIGKNYTAASVYFGFGLKYGRLKSRQQNTNYIPVDDRDFRESFFRRMYKKMFPKKRFEGQRD